MKDVAEENMGIVASYLKGALLLLQNCRATPTNVMGLLTGVMVSADCEEFTSYMTSIYFALKRDSVATGYVEYLSATEGGYRTLYCKDKWVKAINPTKSGFVGDDNKGYYRGGRGGRCPTRGGGRGHGG